MQSPQRFRSPSVLGDLEVESLAGHVCCLLQIKDRLFGACPHL